MTVVGVEVKGLNQLLRDLRKIQSDLPKGMRQALLPISQDVLTGVKRRGQGLGGVHAHAARRGLRAGATQNTGWIKLLATREPTILGAEYGGGARPMTRQFPPWRGSGGGAGYFVWPTIRNMAPEIDRRAAEGLDDVLRSAGFND